MQNALPQPDFREDETRTAVQRRGSSLSVIGSPAFLPGQRRVPTDKSVVVKRNGNGRGPAKRLLRFDLSTR